MGPIGIPELIILFILFGGLPLVAFAITRLLNSKEKPPSLYPVVKTAEVRLAELDQLRSKELISEAEYEEKRKQIVDGV